MVTAGRQGKGLIHFTVAHPIAAPIACFKVHNTAMHLSTSHRRYYHFGSLRPNYRASLWPGPIFYRYRLARTIFRPGFFDKQIGDITNQFLPLGGATLLTLKVSAAKTKEYMTTDRLPYSRIEIGRLAIFLLGANTIVLAKRHWWCSWWLYPRSRYRPLKSLNQRSDPRLKYTLAVISYPRFKRVDWYIGP